MKPTPRRIKTTGTVQNQPVVKNLKGGKVAAGSKKRGRMPAHPLLA